MDEIEFQNVIQPDYLSDRESDRDGGILNMQMYVDSLSDAINTALEQMVDEANNDVRKLSRMSHKKKLFKSGDAILTFNYTSTVEYLFSVPHDVPIFHIHGCYEAGNRLIFGYRSNTNSYGHAWASVDEENWDYYVSQQREAVYAFYDSWRKSLQIDNLRAFLSNCYGIDRVVVLGHSMSAVDVPVTVKIRKGWNNSVVNAVEVAKICEQAGAAAITIHGRTREQYYKPPVDYDIIKEVNNAVSIPVIANGDITSAKIAKEVMDYTGCQLVMVGRASLGNPWIFSEINAYLENPDCIIKAPTLEEKLNVMCRHIEKMVEYKGEHMAMLQARKLISGYFKGMRGAAELRNQSGKVCTLNDLYALKNKALSSVYDA